MRERLLVKKDPGSDRVGDLWIPDTARKSQTIGTVVATGPGYYLGPDSDGEPIYGAMEYKEGDRVLFGEWSGVELAVDGEALWLLTPDEVHAKLVEVDGNASR